MEREKCAVAGSITEREKCAVAESITEREKCAVAEGLTERDPSVMFLSTCTREQDPGQPLVPLPVNDITNVTAGDHVLYHIGSDEHRKDYRSALVSEVDSEHDNLKIITFTRNGVEETRVGLASLHRLHRVEYSTCRFTAEEALSRARWRQDMNEMPYNPIDNNGHFFVTNAKTGREHNLSDMIMDLKAQDTEPDPPTPFAYKCDPLKPVAFQQQMKSITEIQPGQHLLIKKKFQNPQHVLVKSSNPHKNEITVFKEKKGRIAETTMKFPPLERPIFEITYEKEVCHVEGADATVQKAEDAALRAECTSKRHSSHFVTEMKTGSPLTVDESCLLSKDVAPSSLSPITPDVALDEGDHIAVEFEENQFNHGIVLRNMGPSGILTIPNLNGDSTIPTGFIFPTTSGPKVFRVNYEQSVPADQTKERACNAKGNCILSENGPQYFATWAKTGKPVEVNMSQLRMKKAKLRHIRPLYRERVTSHNDIRIGDHLIQGYPTHWFHFLVAAKDPNDPSKVTCIYCLRTKVAECDITLDLQDKNVYRIQYFESFAPEEAIQRAQSQVGKRKWGLHARTWFVRWVKTGSDEGLEVDFLDNCSLPLTKSRIRSFAQLNVGDAIVKKEKFSLTHYYLVTEISSPYECEAIESYFGICKTTVQLDPQNESEIFYRLNYHPGVCFLPGDSVKMATCLVENYTHISQLFDNPLKCLRLTSPCFINYVKTGESNAVDSDILRNDRPLCIRTVKVTSTDELLPGDHIRRPAGRPLPQGSFHHMMVAEKPEEDGSCSVFHFKGEKSVNKATLSQTMEKINGDEVYRICYPERIDPNVSLQFLKRASQYKPGEDHSIPDTPIETNDDNEAQALFQEFVDQKKGDYRLPSNNCEHLIMFAAAHVDMSLQIDEKLYAYLEYHCDIPLTFIQGAFLKLGQKFIQGVAPNGVGCGIRAVCHHVGGIAGAAVARAALRAAIVDAADAATESIAAAGYMSTVRAVSLATGTTFAFVASVVIEISFSVRGIYKLHRKKQFNQINEVTFKRGCARQTTVSAGAVLGGTAGAVVGSFIPVPILGTLLGGAAGAFVGIATGHAVGYGIGFAFKEGKIPDFVIVHTHLYTDYP